MLKRGSIAAALIALLLLAFAGKGLLLPLPSVPPVAAPGTFDALGAKARLARILGDEQPHPVDSDANDAVRARLIAELRALGLAPEVTDEQVCNGFSDARNISCARVRNVTATLGPARGPRLLLVTHYDSSPVGPGAADAGIGVATLLEVAARLRQRQLARPVTLLFDDGEEAGLLGARAFLERSPLARDVDTILNFEARGVTGPAIMFETSRPNGRAIALYRRVVERPAANSLTTDFYGLIPNYTDVTVLSERPWTILNFAIIGNETRYHSPGDTLDALDPRSLAHMGGQALALSAAVAEGRVPEAGGKRLYADLLGRWLLVLPVWLGIGLLILLPILFLWPPRADRGGLGRAAAAAVAALAASALLTWAGQAIVGAIRPGEFWRAHPEAIGLAVNVTALAGSLLALLRIGGRLSPLQLRRGFWLVFVAIGLILCLLAPGAAIFFLAPPLAAGIGLHLRRGGRFAALLGWALLFLSFAPLLQLIEILLDFDAAWTLAPLAGLIMLPVLIELMPLVRSLRRPWLAGGLAAAAILAWTATLLVPAYSADRKQGFGIEYALDSDSGRARWLIVHDGAPLPPAFAGFEAGIEVPWTLRKRHGAEAPRLPLAAPTLETLAASRTAQGRRLTLRLRTYGAETVTLRAKPEARLQAVQAGGSARRFGTGGAKDDFFLRCHGRSCDGAVITLLAGGSAPFDAMLSGSRRGLPAAAAGLVRARPATAAPQYAPDATIAWRKVRL